MLGKAALPLGLLDAPGLRGVNEVVFRLAMPALLFDSVAEADAMHVLDVAAAYFAACLILYALAMLLASRLLGAGVSHAAVFALNATYGNTVMLGIPLVGALFGVAGLGYLMAIIAFHSALLLPLASLLIEAGSQGRPSLPRLVRATLAGMLRNPVILSILLAFAWRGAGLGVPGPLHALLGMLGAPAAPLALFCLGASLPGLPGPATLAEALMAATLKLAVLPALVFVIAGWLGGLHGVALSVALLTAGMPTGANAFLIARRSAGLGDGAASTVLISTLLSVGTLGTLMWWLR